MLAKFLSSGSNNSIGWPPSIFIVVTATAPSGSSKASAKRKRGEALGTEVDVSAGGESDTAPPRKKQASKKGSHQAARARQDAEGGANNNNGGNAGSAAAASASGARRSRAKNKKAAKSADAPVVPDSAWLDVTPWKLERDALDGTFDAARNLFTKYGPWKLPAGLDDSFPEIALSTLSKVSRCVLCWCCCCCRRRCAAFPPLFVLRRTRP